MSLKLQCQYQELLQIRGKQQIMSLHCFATAAHGTAFFYLTCRTHGDLVFFFLPVTALICMHGHRCMRPRPHTHAVHNAVYEVSYCCVLLRSWLSTWRFIMQYSTTGHWWELWLNSGLRIDHLETSLPCHSIQKCKDFWSSPRNNRSQLNSSLLVTLSLQYTLGPKCNCNNSNMTVSCTSNYVLVFVRLNHYVWRIMGSYNLPNLCELKDTATPTVVISQVEMG